MSNDPLPLLYTFRRCPYAIRARMAVLAAGINVDMQEVSLKNKPQAMLDVSNKGTVPVLCVGGLEGKGRVIDESLDIMLWALGINDPDGWYSLYSEADKNNAMQLIQNNDNDFKVWLDRYKYADRFPGQSPEYYREKCGIFLLQLEDILKNSSCLLASRITLADIAIFPFVRQFSMVDKAWFDQCHYPGVRTWLNTLLDLPLFSRVMAKSFSNKGE